MFYRPVSATTRSALQKIFKCQAELGGNIKHFTEHGVSDYNILHKVSSASVGINSRRGHDDVYGGAEGENVPA